MNQDWKQVVTELVGTPFKWQGRGDGGHDCWSLLREALRRLGRPVPPDYDTPTPESATRAISANLQPPHWVHREVPEPGDVAMMSVRGTIHHTGLVTPYGILHTSRKLGAVIMSESTLRSCGYQRIEYYRWVE